MKLAIELLQEEIIRRTAELAEAGVDSATDLRLRALEQAAQGIDDGALFQFLDEAARLAGRPLTRDELLALLVPQ